MQDRGRLLTLERLLDRVLSEAVTGTRLLTFLADEQLSGNPNVKEIMKKYSFVM